MKKYLLSELRKEAIATFLNTCVYVLKIEYGIDDRIKVFDACGTAIESGDCVLFGRPSRCKVRYTRNGLAYILHAGRRYHLNRTYRLQAE